MQSLFAFLLTAIILLAAIKRLLQEQTPSLSTSEVQTCQMLCALCFAAFAIQGIIPFENWSELLSDDVLVFLDSLRGLRR